MPRFELPTRLTKRLRRGWDSALERVRVLIESQADLRYERGLDLAVLEDRVLLSAAPVAVAALAPQTVDVAVIQPANDAGGVDPTDLDAVMLSLDAASVSDAGASCESALDSFEVRTSEFLVTSDAEANEAFLRESRLNDVDGAECESRSDVAYEIAFVDSGAADFQQLVNDLNAQREAGRNIDVFVLDASRDGIEQITEALVNRRDVDAVHIVSHATDRGVKLGSSWLTVDSLSGNAGRIANWGWALSSDADVLFYGCDLAANESGRELLESIASLTGADVAASDDDTGSSTLGGDWNLEYQLGDVGNATETALFSSEVWAQWDGLLNTFVVTSTADSGAGSLRQAILDANGLNGLDTITFNISGAGVHTISLLSELPDIMDSVVIDGTTELDFSGTPLIELDGRTAGAGANGLTLRTGSSTVRGLSIFGFTGNGVAMQSDSNVLVGSYVGLRADGSVLANGGDGVLVTGQFNLIGGTTAADRNVISGNMGFGVTVFANTSTSNTVSGNFIGTNVLGTASIGNQLGGVQLDRARFTVIGGLAAGSRNVISGNVGSGVFVTGTTADFNQIYGNLIGVAADGVTSLGNSGHGVNLTGGATGNEVGDGSAAGSNTIRFNGGHGIVLTDAASSTIENSIRRNSIGDNGGLGIDIENDGVDVNDPSDGDVGANDRQNAPVITLVTTDGASTTIYGLLNSIPSTLFDIDLYSSPTADGEGQTYLGTVSVTTDGVNGDATFVTTLPTVIAAGDVVTATATQNGGNTSEFGAAIPANSYVLLSPQGETLVNGSPANAQETSGENRGSTNAVAIASDGTYFVVWSEQPAGQNWRVMLRRFDSDGTALTGPIQVSATGGPHAQWANVAVDAFGRAVVTWKKNDIGNDIYARRVHADGSMNGAEFRVNTVTSNNQENSTVAMDLAGNFVITWEGEGPGDTSGVFARRYTAAGTPIGNEFRVNTVTAGTQGEPSVAMNGSGEFAIVWDASDGVHGQRYDATGTPVGGQFTVDNGTSSGEAAVAMGSDGRFVVTWRETAFDVGIYARRYDEFGVDQGPAFVVNSEIFGDQTNPSIAMDAIGNFIIVYEGESFSDSLGVYARRYDETGTPLGFSSLVNTTTANTQHMTSVAMQDLDNYVVVWSGEGPGDTNGVFSRQYGTAVPNTPPTITSNGGGASASISVAENTTAVTTVAATDADVPAQVLSYSISGGVDSAAFVIDGTTGALTFVTAPNFEAPTDAGGNNVYDVNVRVSDGTLTDTQSIAITVQNNTIALSGASVPEMAANGTAVGVASVSEVNLITDGTFMGAGTPANFTTYNLGQTFGAWTVSQGKVDLLGTAYDDSPLGGNSVDLGGAITGSGGAPGTISQMLTIVPGQQYLVRFQLSGNWAVDSTTKDVRVSFGGTTQDISITRPAGWDFSTDMKWALRTLTFTATSTSTVLSFQSMDPAGEGPVVADVNVIADPGSYSYSLTDDAGGRFAIHPTTGTVTVANGSLFDFETATNHDILVRVTSGATLVEEQLFNIAVTAVNDNTPVITSNGGGLNASVNVAENTTAVTTVTATDADMPAQTPTFTISGGSDSAKFTINGSSGALSFLSAPDFEAPTDVGGNNVYDVQVRVTDGSLTDTQDIAVTVTNSTTGDVLLAVQDTSIHKDFPTLDYGQSVSLLLDRSGGSLGDGRILLQFNLGDLPANATITSATLVMNATQNGGALNIEVHRVTQAWVEGTGNGAVGAASWNERQPGINWLSSGGDFNSTVIATLNTGATGQHSWNVTSLVTDWYLGNQTNQGLILGSQNTGTTTVTYDSAEGTFAPRLLVTFDATNAPPVITSNGGAGSAAVSIAENNTVVTAVTATDADLPAQTLSYSIIGGADSALFSINSSSGVLSFVSGRDRELATDADSDHVYEVTVQASDGNGGTDVQAISVTITDVDEFNVTSPTDTNGTADAVNENAANGTPVGITAVASDADATTNTVTYSLFDNAGGRFTIDTNTGIVTVANGLLLDREAAASHSIVVRATSADTSSSTQAYTISLNPLNDNNPVITSNAGGATAAIGIAENTTAMTTVTATDADLPGQSLTYSISGGADAAKFAIDSSSGVLTFVSAPDFESPTDVGGNNVYDVQVRVTDGSLTDTQDIAVTVTNVNEPPTITSNGGGAAAAINVVENSTSVTTVTSTDPDAGATKTFSITGGADAAKFAINSSTGALTFVTVPNFESPTDVGGNNVYDVQVQVTDGSLTDTQDIAVTVTNDNEAPVMNAGTFSLAENSTVGTVVGSAIATDPDAGDTRNFVITGGNLGGVFAINGSTGQITVANSAALDFETNPTFALTVQVTDGGGLQDSDTVTINLTNVAEPPSITSNGGGASATISIAENSTPVTTVTATDTDAGSTLTFSISGGADSTRFTINPTTGALSFNSGRNFENPVDAGANNIYDVIVRVSDGVLTDTQAIAVTITNVNEAPTINSNGGGATAAISLVENTTTVTTVTATDPDAASSLTFSISGGLDAALFSIDTSTGALTFLAAPNFELPTDNGPDNVYNVNVRVTDGALTDTQNIAITITNANETPAITSNGGGASAAISLAEDTTAVTTVTASDPDAGASLSFSISGGADAGLFTISSTTGALSFVSGRNFEAPTDAGLNNIYDVIVRVTDGTLTDTQAIAVTITDANDPPVITSNGGGNNATLNVLENTTAVTTIIAADPDPGASLTFTITSGADAGLFVINPTTGVLSFITPRDFETPGDVGPNNIYDVTVEVSDGIVTDSQNLAVTITNVNEAPTMNSATFSLAENAAVNTLVGTATATDPDAGDTRNFVITGGNLGGAFAINGSTGQITVANSTPINFELNPTFNLTVRVTDGGGLQSSNTVTINLSDNIDAPAVIPVDFSLPENSAASTSVGSVTATDPDLGDTQTWTITSGNIGGAFLINATTGEITVANPIPVNFETNPIFTLQVRATDNGGLSDVGAITINLSNVNEAPILNDGIRSIGDDATNGTIVIDLNAFDPDASDPCTFAILAGNVGGAFGINPLTGRIAVQSQLNPATTPIYSLTVQVTDSLGLTDTATVTINVTTTNPIVAPPPPSSGGSPNNNNSNSGGSGSTSTATGGNSSSENGGSSPIIAPPPSGSSSSSSSRNNDNENAPAPIGSGSLTNSNADADSDKGSGMFLVTGESLIKKSASSDRSDMRMAAANARGADSRLNAEDVIAELGLSQSLRFGNEDLSFLVDQQYLTELKEVQETLGDAPITPQWVTGSAAATSAGLTIGYILWLLRSGYLVTSVLATLPMWQSVDPLPILAQLDDDEDDESLDEMIQRAEQEHEKPELPTFSSV